MDLTIPRKDLSDMVLYIWKIIGLSSISSSDLLYSLSFELFLFDPKEAKKFVETAISQKYLILERGDNLKLSKELNQELSMWQIKRKEEISERLTSSKRIKDLRVEKGNLIINSNQFKTLFKLFVDEVTAGRSASILQSDIKLLKFDDKTGILKATVKGSQENIYKIEINVKLKILKHDCHDFQTRKSKSKKFCKHLARLFFLLKEQDETSATYFLKEIGDNINDWEFND
ncbi:MAG: DUF2240 family protein [Candidatus Lokiarchaeota archaeon]|nr:DUF2240 family protein [Candidatus Lokiarchaeota archaeon]